MPFILLPDAIHPCHPSLPYLKSFYSSIAVLQLCVLSHHISIRLLLYNCTHLFFLSFWGFFSHAMHTMCAYCRNTQLYWFPRKGMRTSPMMLSCRDSCIYVHVDEVVTLKLFWWLKFLVLTLCLPSPSLDCELFSLLIIIISYFLFICQLIKNNHSNSIRRKK